MLYYNTIQYTSNTCTKLIRDGCVLSNEGLLSLSIRVFVLV